MSYANFVGDTPQGDTTRIDTLITERIKRVSVFQNIDIEGDIDLGQTGRVVGTLGVETPQLTTQADTVAQLNGTDISFSNDVELGGKMTFGSGAVAINVGDFAGDASGSNVGIGDISGSVENNIVINATGTPLEATETSACYLAPLRGVAQGLGVGVVFYDPATGELAYSTD